MQIYVVLQEAIYSSELFIGADQDYSVLLGASLCFKTYRIEALKKNTQKREDFLFEFRVP
jgi:hypothetical protein